MVIDFLLKVFCENRTSDAIVWNTKTYNYEWILTRLGFWRKQLSEKNVLSGSVVILQADYSPDSIAFLLALIEHKCITVPITSLSESKKEEFIKIAQAEISVQLTDQGFSLQRLSYSADHLHYQKLRNSLHPGLVLFSSGSTGDSKAAVHDFSLLLEKYKLRRHNLRTLTFLLFDHIGGVDTMFYSLSNGSCLVTINEDRSPDNVCLNIEKYKVEVLPVSPTFLNLLLLSEADKRYNLSSLKFITYGAEVMPQATLKKCAERFPWVTLQQKFGTTEIGTLRSKSKKSDSLWVKIGGEGYKTRIVDGILQIKASSMMLGYLNAPQPFTEDGWFITGDRVETEGDYIKILGRITDIINVGGEKVYPQEVENCILEIDNIAEVMVYEEKNSITGNIVCARVRMDVPEEPTSLIKKIKAHCRKSLQNFKVPVKISFFENELETNRFKVVRKKENFPGTNKN